MSVASVAERKKNAKIDLRNKYIFWLVVVVTHVVLFLPSFLFEPLKISFGEEPTYFHWVYFSVFLCVLLNLLPFSWKTQKQGFVGGKNAFGALLYQTGPGPIYLFWGICTHEPEECRLNNKEIPTDIQDRYPPDQKDRLRMTTAPAQGNSAGSGDDPLATGRLTLEVSIPIEWKLSSEPGAWRQWVDKVGSPERLLEIIDDRVVNEVRKEVTIHTPSEVFTEWRTIEAKALAQVDEISDAGLDSLRVRVKEFDLPERVNKALADRTAQHANVETKRLEGLADKLKDELRAHGLRALAEAPLQAVVNVVEEGVRKGMTSEELGRLAYAQLMQTALQNAQYSLIPQGSGGVLDPATLAALFEAGRRATPPAQNTGNPPPSGTGDTP